MPKFADYLGNKEYLTGTISLADFFLFELVETILGLCHDTRVFQAHPNI